MRYATEKQIGLIRKLKAFVDCDGENIIDDVDLARVSIRDASTVIDGLLGIKYEYKRLAYGQSLSCNLDGSLDKVYDTLEKYKTA